MVDFNHGHIRRYTKYRINQEYLPSNITRYVTGVTQLTSSLLLAAGYTLSMISVVHAQGNESVVDAAKNGGAVVQAQSQATSQANAQSTNAASTSAAGSPLSSASVVDNPKDATATGSAPVQPAPTGNDAPDSSGQAAPQKLDAIVVNARNRSEKMQDVPIPVSVVNGDQAGKDDKITLADFAQEAAGIIVNPQNARQSSISMRGLGKQGATDAMESSVGLIVDDVFFAYSAYSWADYVDLDSVAILRGPQGTLLGKNTTLGVVSISTKLPSFTPQYTFQSTVGSRNTFIEQASATGPLIDGLLAYRASISADHANGPVSNAYPNGQTFGNRERYGGRFQLLFTPTSDLSARIIVNHQYSDEFDNGNSVLVKDPATYANGASRTANGAQTFTSRLNRSWFNGYQPVYGSTNQVDINAQLPVINQQDGASAEIKWNHDGYTLTSITSYNRYKFVARNDGDNTPFNISYNANSDATQWQASQELRLNSPIGPAVDYQVGLYGLKEKIQTNSKSEYGTDAGAFYATSAQYASLDSTAAGRELLSNSLNGVYTRVTQFPSVSSVAAYGQLNWHLTSRATLTLGLRETAESRESDLEKTLINGGVPIAANDATAQSYFGVPYSALTAAQKTQITNAIAVRNGQIGTLYGYVAGIPIHQNSTSWLFNPSFKLTDNTLLYASASFGEKSGVVLFNTSTGAPQNAAPERAWDFEVGVKSSLLNHTWLIDANLYNTLIKGYQQQLEIADPTQASGYRNVTGNVNDVLLRGIEFDTAYVGIKNLRLWAAGSYGQAIYKSFNNATCPAEVSNVASICDLSGQQLPGASKAIVNVGAQYAHPLPDGFLFHTDFNVAYRSRSNLDSTLSINGWQKGYEVTDVGVGIGRQNGSWDVSLIVKNLFNTNYALALSNYSATAPVTEEVGDPRFFGVVFRARLD